MVQTSIQSVIPAREIKDARTVSEHLARLEKLFGVEFSAIEVATGDVIHRASDPPPGDWLARGELSREVARRQTAEVIEERGSVLVIALPLVGMQGTNYVAVAGFVTEPVPTDADVEGLAHAMCVSAAEAADWIARQTPWRAERLLNMAALTAEHDVAGIRAARFEVHVNDLSDNLSQTYEEISLLHRIAGNLNISERNGELLQLALEWLYDLVPAAAVLAYIDGSDGENRGLRGEWLQSNFHAMGRSPINLAQFQELIGEVSLQSGDQTVVLNKGFTQQEGWRFPSIQHLVVVPVSAGDQVWGYLAALNNNEQGDFGTIEASLMSSVATMLAVHIGNIRLYTDQVQLLSGMLQALVSAIDAKDPYTCGHSNRVARVALCLAEQLGCSDKLKNTV